MGSKKKVTIGYKYYLGMHMVICHGPIDSLTRIDVAERTAWSGNVTGTSTIYIDQPELFGGEQKEGGIKGYVDIEMGLSTQPKNSYLTSKLGAVIPAFRGVVGIVLNQVYLTAITPYPKPWSFLVKRIPGRDWYNAKAEINEGANGAHIIYEVLTNKDWGMGYSVNSIDTVSFISVADTLYAEGLSLSFELSNTDSIESFLYSVVKHINAVFYTKPDTGLFALKLLRDDYNILTLPEYNESNVTVLDSFERASYSEVINEISVVYRPQGTDKDDSVTVQDLAAIQAQEGIVSQTINYPGIDNASNAARVAMRDLRQKSTPLARVKFKTLRSSWSSTIGDVIKFTWAEHGISGMVLRILDVNYGELTSGEITLNCVEDVFGLPATTYVGDQPSGWVDPIQPPQAAAYHAIMEATYWDIARTFTEADFAYVTNTSAYTKYLVGNPSAPSINYEYWSKSGGGSYAFASDGNFAPHATLSADITYIQTSFTLTGLSGNTDIFVMGGYGLIESEIIRIDSYNPLTGAIVVGRGCIDTVPSVHLTGTRLYFLDGFQAFDVLERSVGETIYGRALIRTGLDLLSISSAPEDSVAMVGRFAKPYPPGNLRLMGLSYPTQVTDDLIVTWAHRDKTLQLATLIDHTSGNIGPEAGTTYNLEIRKISDNSLMDSAYNLTGTTFTSGLFFSTVSVKITLWSVVSGRRCFQDVVCNFVLNNPQNIMTEASELILCEDGDYLIL